MSDKTKPALLYVLSALIFIESLGILAYAIYLGIEIFFGHPTSVATSVAIALTVVALAVLVFVIGIAALRGRPWIRGAMLAIAVLQLLTGGSIIVTSAPTLGWILVVPAVIVIVLLFTPPVLRATSRPPRED